jgi:hypothetical protein
VGGSARSWSTRLPGRLVPGSVVRVRLVMTKFGPPQVLIGYALELR